MTIHWKAVEQYFTVVLLFFGFTQFGIVVNLSVLDLALSGVKGSIRVANMQIPVLDGAFPSREVGVFHACVAVENVGHYASFFDPY